MSSITDKLRDMEEAEERQKRTYTVSDQLNVFDHYFAAALTGVISHIDSDSHGDKELIEQAFNLATLAFNKRKQR